jgi:hypothetical protein
MRHCGKPEEVFRGDQSGSEGDAWIDCEGASAVLPHPKLDVQPHLLVELPVEATAADEHAETPGELSKTCHQSTQAACKTRMIAVMTRSNLVTSACS